jgi:hypothetical protein
MSRGWDSLVDGSTKGGSARMSIRAKTTLNTTANRLRTSVGIVLLVAASLAAGTARAADPGTIAYTQSCDGQSVTLVVTATGYTPYETLQLVVDRAAPPYDQLAASQPIVSNANAVASATFTGLPPSTSVFIVVEELISGGGPFRSGEFTLLSCSAQAQLTALVAQVQGLDTNAGIANSLDAKLSHIDDALSAAKSNSLGVACNSLNAFLNEVAAQAQSQVITAAQAAALTNDAMSIQKALGC